MQNTFSLAPCPCDLTLKPISLKVERPNQRVMKVIDMSMQGTGNEYKIRLCLRLGESIKYDDKKISQGEKRALSLRYIHGFHLRFLHL